MGTLAFLMEWIYLFAGVLFLITFKVAGSTVAYWTLVAIGTLMLISQIYHRRFFHTKTAIAVLMAAGGLYAALTNSPATLFFYPLLVNLTLFFTFAISLGEEETIIQKIASRKHGKLDDDTKKYTRTLTKVWTAFIGVNTLLTAYTVWLQDLDLWSMYNGFISYIALGTLATGELVFRHFYQQRRKFS